jgi:tetratricopeptide (TPR) repeat protein
LLRQAVSRAQSSAHFYPSGRPQALIDEGREYIDAGEFRDAVEANTKTIEIAQTSSQAATAYNNRGVANSRLGLTQSAIDDYTTAIEIDPQALYFSNRGWAYLDLGKTALADVDFDNARMRNTSLANLPTPSPHPTEPPRPTATIAPTPMVGASRFVSTGQYLGVAERYTHAVAVGDIDSDLDLDLLTVVSGVDNAGLQVWRNDGSGGFTQGNLYKAWNHANIAVEDVDGDGDLDVITSGQNNFSVWVNLTGSLTTLGRCEYSPRVMGEFDKALAIDPES